MEPQKKSVSVDITKHIRKYINFNGDEISREEALGISPKISRQPQVNRDTTEDPKGNKGEEGKEETK